MDKRFDEPLPDLDHTDFLKASQFAFDFQRGVSVTLVGIKEGVPLVARTFGVGKIAEAAAWIEQQNRNRYNIYFHVNVTHDGAHDRKAKKADIVSVHGRSAFVTPVSQNAPD